MRERKKIGPRERILEVADRLFYAEGVRATGTEKIMAVAEVAKATFYRHFESKDALVLAYLDHRDQSFWNYLLSPAPPEDVHEALVRMERLVNLPEISSCPFLRIASEYMETDHAFHRRAIEHKDKLHTYFVGLLKSYPVDNNELAARMLDVFDGVLSRRMVYGTSESISLVSSAEAILKGFQIA